MWGLSKVSWLFPYSSKSILDFGLGSNRSGVTSGIFRRGATLSTRGLKYGVQGTINAKNIRKNRFSPSNGGASMFQRVTIAP